MLKRYLILLLCVCLLPLPQTYAQELVLPVPGTMVSVSPALNPSVLKGIKVHPENPLKFDFVLAQGDNTSAVASAKADYLKQESNKLVKYFLAALTTPEKDMWVNLSPYEKNRIVPDSFGQTEMGRDLLAQDYLLKQLTASLVYPEGDLGKAFWKRIYQESKNKNIPVSTFNKVWIVPDKVVVYENIQNGTAYIVESSLKVLTEQDYLATSVIASEAKQSKIATMPAASRDDILRDIVIPQLTKEVNEGANFAQLRQVYNSLILATWYKKKIKNSIINQVYTDKNKIKGTEYTRSIINRSQPGDMSQGVGQVIEETCPQASCQANDGWKVKAKDVDIIYNRYLTAFKKGAYNFIKEEVDPITHQVTPKKYFSGGVKFGSLAMIATTQAPQVTNDVLAIVPVALSADHAQTTPDYSARLPDGIDPLDVVTHTAYGRHFDFDAWARSQQDFIKAKRMIEIGLGGLSSPTFIEWAKGRSNQQYLIGVDPNEHIVKDARSKAKEQKLENIEVKQGALGMGKTIAAPNSIDYVRMFNVAAHYYFNPPQLKRMHDEITTMLKEEGVYVEQDDGAYVYMRKVNRKLAIEKIVLNLNKVLDNVQYMNHEDNYWLSIDPTTQGLEKKLRHLISGVNLRYAIIKAESSSNPPAFEFKEYSKVFDQVFQNMFSSEWSWRFENEMLVIERQLDRKDAAMAASADDRENDFVEVAESSSVLAEEKAALKERQLFGLKTILKQLASADSRVRNKTASLALREYRIDESLWINALIDNFINPSGIKEAEVEYNRSPELNALSGSFSYEDARRNARAASLFALKVRINDVQYNASTYGEMDRLNSIQETMRERLASELAAWGEKKLVPMKEKVMVRNHFLGHDAKQLPASIGLIENLRLFILAFEEVKDPRFRSDYSKWIRASMMTLLSIDISETSKQARKIVTDVDDQAMSATGGIDFNPQVIDAQLSNDNGMNFRIDEAMINALAKADGFTPQVLDIKPLPQGAAGTAALWSFLGIRHD